MKKLILFAMLFTIFSALNAQNSLNMSELSNWDNDSLPGHTYGTFNDVWGYADSEEREYAIMGSASYIHFFNISDPANPVLIDQFLGGSSIVWRDFKTYEDRAYACSDASGEGLHIFDLSNLPDTVIQTNQTMEFFGSAHNIFIDEPNGRLYAVGVNTGTDIVVLDIATDPDEPILLSSAQLPTTDGSGYIHDAYVRDNFVYASHGFAGLYVWDFTDANDPKYVASFVRASTEGYNHSSWVSEDGNTMIFAEEVPTGLPMGIADLTDMANDNIVLYPDFKFPLLFPHHINNTPHNPYLLGNHAYTSYYEDGVQIFDISDPENPELAGYYDTYPSNTEYNGYAGCWGVYPYLPSGNILASDMSNGLFVLEFDEIVNTNQLPDNISSFEVSPNPTDGIFKIELNSQTQTLMRLSLTSLTGQLVQEKNISFNGKYDDWLDISDLPSGMYFLSIGDDNQTGTKKIIKN